MDEYIDILNPSGKPIGQSAPKSIIHQKGHYHNTAHIWFYTTNGEILLAQRSAKKTIRPLLWDVSVAGHVDAGETIKQAAVRETKEEIGLSILENDLIEIGIFKCFKSYKNGIIDNEFHNTFTSKLKVPLTELTPQFEEVEALKLVSLQEFNQLIKTIGNNGNHFVASNASYYKTVLNSISNSLKFC